MEGSEGVGVSGVVKEEAGEDDNKTGGTTRSRRGLVKKDKETGGVGVEMEEEKERRRKRDAERKRRQRAQRTEEQVEEDRRKMREGWHRRKAKKEKVPEEDEKNQKRQKKENKKKKRDRRTLTDEERRREQQMKKYMWKQAKLAMMDKEERERWRERQRERERKWRESLSHEQRKLYNERKLGAVKKCNAKPETKKRIAAYYARPEVKNKYYERTRLRNREMVANETEEERGKRLMRYKVYQAKRRLKGKLEEEGELSLEEIEERLKQLEEEIRSQPYQPSGKPYQPRLQARKPRRKGGCDRDKLNDAPVELEIMPKPNSPYSHIDEQDEEDYSHIDGGDEVNYSHIDGGNEEDYSHIDEGNEEDYSHIDEGNEEDYSHIEGGNDEDDLLLCPSPLDCHSASPTATVVESEANVTEYLKCRHCSIGHLTNQDELRNHVLSSHPSKCWKCPKCKQITPSPADLNEHYKSHHVK